MTQAGSNDVVKPGQERLPPVWTVFAAILVYGGIALYFFPTARGLLDKYRWWVVLAVALLTIAAFIPGVRNWLKTATVGARAVVTIFGVVPIMLLIIVGPAFALPRYTVMIVRAVFLLVATLLPAIMYYLFIQTRRFSLLNEFLVNLDRLGLFAPQAAEAEADRQRRIHTYLLKFEALYGRFQGPGTADKVLKSTDPKDNSRTYSTSITQEDLPSIFTQEITLPVAVATLVITLGWILILPPWQPGSPVASILETFSPVQAPVHFAFLGGYFFSIQMLFRRYARRDIRGGPYLSVALRVILAVIGIWIATAALATREPIVSPLLLSVIGFVIGAFPPVLWQVVTGAVKPIAGLALPKLKTELPVTDLDGLTVWHEARLEEEDVENIPNMATADIVELMLQTRFPPDRIIDWVDQAILYTYLGSGKDGKDRRQMLARHGIRNASTLVEVFRKSKAHGDQMKLERILGTSEADRSPVLSLVDAVPTNPNLALVLKWIGLPPMERQEQPRAA